MKRRALFPCKQIVGAILLISTVVAAQAQNPQLFHLRNSKGLIEQTSSLTDTQYHLLRFQTDHSPSAWAEFSHTNSPFRLSTGNGFELYTNNAFRMSVDSNGRFRFAGVTNDNTQTRILVTDASGNLFYKTIQAANIVNSPVGGSGYRLSTLSNDTAYIKKLIAGTNLTIDSTTTPGALILNASTGPYTASNGLTLTGSNFTLGGTLTSNTIIDGGLNYGLTSTSGVGPNAATFSAINTNTGAAIIARAVTQTAISSTSSSGVGLYGASNSNLAIYGLSNTGYAAAEFDILAVSANSNQSILRLLRASTSTATAGISGSIDYYTQAGDGNSYSSNQLLSSWTNVTPSARTSKFQILGVNNNSALTAYFTTKGGGQLQGNLYGAGSFTGTATFNLAVDASGNIIEVAAGGGTGGGFTNSNIGSGYRFAVPSTNNIKTLFGGYGVLLDSTSNSNAITARIDTTTLFSRFQSPLTFNNGLTLTGSNAQLGGTLVQNTTINGGSTYGLISTSSVAATIPTLQGINTGAGDGIYGQATSGRGVIGSATTGTAIAGNSVSGAGLSVVSNSSLAGIFDIYPTSTNTVPTILQLLRQTSGTASNGIGESVDFAIQTSSGVGWPSNQLISKWTDATVATRTSQFEIWGTNSSVLARKFAITGNGGLIADTYGSGSHSGTAAYALSVDGSGNIIETTAGGSGGTPNSNIGSGYRFAIPGTNNIKTLFGGYGVLVDSISNSNALTAKIDTTTLFSRFQSPLTFNNGLTLTGSNAQLGGALTQNTTINGGANYTLSTTSSVSGSSTTFSAINTGTGAAITGQSVSQVAISGLSTNGTGVYATSTSGLGIQATTSSGPAAASFAATPSSTNTNQPILQLIRASTGTAAAGISGSIDYYNQTSDGNGYRSNQLLSGWTNVTPSTRTSQFQILGVNNNSALTAYFTAKGGGQLQGNLYGAGSFTGTATYNLAVDASGNIIEVAAGGGAGGGFTNSNIGSGFRFAVSATNNIKTFFGGYGVLLDSTSNSNAITARIDTTTLKAKFQTPLTFNNGLTLNGANAQLGGAFLQNTRIAGGNVFNLIVDSMNAISMIGRRSSDSGYYQLAISPVIGQAALQAGTVRANAQVYAGTSGSNGSIALLSAHLGSSANYGSPELYANAADSSIGVQASRVYYDTDTTLGGLSGFYIRALPYSSSGTLYSLAWNRATGRIYAAPTIGSGSTGTVTSVATGYGLTGGTITTTGTLVADTTKLVPYTDTAKSGGIATQTYVLNHINTGTVTNVSTTNGYGITSSVANSSTTPNITIGTDTTKIIPYTDTAKSNGMASKTFVTTQGYLKTAVTSVGSGYGLTGGTITGTGTLVADTTKLMPYTDTAKAGGIATQTYVLNHSNSGTVTNVSTTNGYGIISSVASATSTPNVTVGVDTTKLIPYTDTSKANGMATKTYVISQGYLKKIYAGTNITLDSTTHTDGITINATGGAAADSVVTISSGTSSSVPNGCNIIAFKPTSAIASYTLTLPTTWHSNKDLIIAFPQATITSGDVISVLTIVAGSGQTLSQAVVPTTGTAGEIIRYHLIGNIDQRIN